MPRAQGWGLMEKEDRPLENAKPFINRWSQLGINKEFGGCVQCASASLAFCLCFDSFLRLETDRKSEKSPRSCWGDDIESLLLLGPGPAFFCIYTDCGSHPTCVVRRWYCPLILLETQNELYFLSPSRHLFLVLSGAHTCAYSHTKGFTHSSILKQQPSFTTRKSIRSYPCLLPSPSETRGLLTQPWTENTGEHDHGCQHLLPWKTFRSQFHIRDAFSNGGPITMSQLQKGSLSNEGHVRPKLFSKITIIQTYRLLPINLTLFDSHNCANTYSYPYRTEKQTGTQGI